MNKKEALIIVSGVIILAVIILIAYFLPRQPEGQLTAQTVKILTDRSEYSPGDALKVKIENNLEEKICFSSCYPYYIQKRNGNWESYHYIECSKENVVDNCVDPKTVKAFELEVPPVNDGPHRLAIGACLNCELKELFRKEKNFFSNRFFVK